MSVANQASFHFVINGDNRSFTVKEWQGWQGLADCSNFRIVVAAKQLINAKNYLMQAATLLVEIAADKINYVGIITQCELLAIINAEHYIYQFQLVDPLARLQFFQTNQVFLQQSLPEIAQAVLKNANVNAKWVLTASYSKQAMVMQLNENDLLFFNRILRQAGLIYCWRYADESWQLWLGEDINQSMPQTIVLAYAEESGLVRQQSSIYLLVEINQLLPQSFQLETTTDEAGNKLLNSNTQTDSIAPALGTHYYYGLEAPDNNSVKKLTQFIKSATDTKRQLFFAKTDCARFQPGDILQLQYHPNPSYNQSYRVIAVQQQAEQYGDTLTDNAAVSFTPTYQAELWLIPIKQTFRHMPHHAPIINHVYSAMITSPEGNNNFPYLDQQGRYLINFPFIPDKHITSKFLRLMQHHGGASDVENLATGLHYPLRPQTQVALAFLHNNPNRPIILGAVHYPENPSPTTSSNATQAVVRTISGNEITLEDQPNAPFLRLATRDLQNKIIFDATPGQPQIQCITEQGKIQNFAKQDLHLQTDDNLIQNTQQNHAITVQQQHLLVTKNQSIQHQAAGNIQLNAQQHLAMQSNNHSLQSNQTLQLQAGRNLIFNNQEGNAQLLAQQGDLTVQAEQNILLNSNSGNVTVGQPQGGITATSDGSLYFTGPNVRLEAPEINIYGLSTFNTTQSSFQYQPSLLNQNNNQQNSTHTSNDEFNLFVATVYGEAASCSAVAWQAVGSVIINRLSCREYRKYKTVTQIIENTRFQAYDDKTLNFTSAYNYLQKLSLNKPLRIDEIVNVLWPIYYNNETITQADHYYSPKAQHIGHNKNKEKYHDDVPNWVKAGINSGRLRIVSIPGLNINTDDFVFLEMIK